MTEKNARLAPDFTEGVDRKLLRQIRDRFLRLNQIRLRRATDAMPMRHADVLEILPLLFHVNHPLLPGYVARQVPCGLSNYTPSKAALSIAKTFSQTFRYTRDKRNLPAIMSVFMMGSSGTLAHSESSDVDLWCCHVPELNREELDLLAKKAERIDRWANSIGLELHTFLMDAKRFREREVSPSVDSESSGSTQHYLLLDEFYRSAIWLGGRTPLWWLVPVYMETDYAKHADWLLTQRFVKESEVIDFGSVATIPKNELLGAGLWQLYKSLDAPYKSALKLLLAEVYARELPEKHCLSLSFKDAVYGDEREVDKLDSYYLIYARLEEYLRYRGETKRLELIRKSFYLKVAKPLSHSPKNRRASWQRLVLQGLVDQWGWSPRTVKQLDLRREWKVDQVLSERQELLSELTLCYRFLSDYARANGIVSTMTASDLTLLGRKLYATYQRKAGKIERVNPGIAPSLWEENLALHHSSGQEFVSGNNAWLVYRDLQAGDDASYHPSIYKSSNLIEAIAWLYFNGILSNSTRLSINPGNTGVRLEEARHIITAMQRSIALPLKPVTQEAYLEPASVQKLLLFINIGVDPMAGLSQEGTLRLSDQSDSLVYSSRRHNLVKTIDQVALNSWNELSSRRYELGETLMQNLQSYLLMCREQLANSVCDVEVYCFASARADAIAYRIKELFKDVYHGFFSAKGVLPIRYIIEVGSSYYQIQWVDQQFRYMSFGSEETLRHALSKHSGIYAPVVLDRYALVQDDLMRLAIARNHPRKTQIFYRVYAGVMELAITDEMGAVKAFQVSQVNEELVIASLHTFLLGMSERRELDHDLSRRSDPDEIIFYRVRGAAGSKLSIKQIKQEGAIEHYGVCAHVYYEGLESRYDLSFAGKEFAYVDYRDRQIDALLGFIQSLPDYTDRRPLLLQELSFASDPMLMRSVFANDHNTLEAISFFFAITQGLSMHWKQT